MNMERNSNRGFVLIAIKLFKGAFVSKTIMEVEERLRLSWKNLDLFVLVVWPVTWVMRFKDRFRFDLNSLEEFIEVYLDSS